MSIIKKILRKNKINQNNNSAPKKNINSTQEDTSVNITLPSELHIELVQANEIRNYEIFQWLTTITTTVAAAFGTSYFLVEKITEKNVLLWSTALFIIMSIIFIYLAYIYRKRAFSKTIKRSINLAEFRFSEHNQSNKKSRN